MYSDKFTRGARSYFFDIKKTGKGEPYLVISESKKTSNGFEHHRLMVFEEDIHDFREAIWRSLDVFKHLKNTLKSEKKNPEV